MDKRTGIILAVTCLVVLVLIAIVFVEDSKTAEIPSDVLLMVGNNQYTADDYKANRVLSNYDNGDITKEASSGDDLNQELNDYILDKLYYNAALKHKVKSTSDTDYSAEYEEKKAELEPYGITSEQYVTYKQEKDLVQALKNNFGEYYSVPDDTYNAVVDSYKDSGEYSTYSFRIMSIPYEEKKEEVSGDNVEEPVAEEQTTDESGEKQDTSKEAQTVVAQDVVSRFRAGEDFQELAKEFGSMRFTFVGSGYSLLNAGDLEYATSPLLKSKLGSSDEVYDAFMKLQPGECTDPIDQEEYTAFQIVKLESVEEGFVGEGEKELKAILLSEIADNLIIQESNYDVNQSGIYQAF